LERFRYGVYIIANAIVLNSYIFIGKLLKKILIENG
jgi:hypothetical protein